MKRIQQLLRIHNIDLKHCLKTNALACAKHGKIVDVQVDACRPRVVRLIQDKQPTVILVLGQQALRSVVGHYFKGAPGTIDRWAGNVIPCQEANAYIVPTWNPAILKKDDSPQRFLHFQKHIEKACELTNRSKRPFAVVPDYTTQINVEISPTAAAKWLSDVPESNAWLSFDYECTGLKPDPLTAEIASCAVCWRSFDGSQGGTMAFPWTGPVIPAMKRILQNGTKKIAANLKFEERWTQNIFGMSVNNWAWDTMLAAHVLDNRPSVTGLNYQCFSLLGFPPYDDHIKSYLKAETANSVNRVFELDLQDLLLYNGLDALLEYKVAMKQMQLLERF